MRTLCVCACVCDSFNPCKSIKVIIEVILITILKNIIRNLSLPHYRIGGFSPLKEFQVDKMNMCHFLNAYYLFYRIVYVDYLT